MKRKHFKNYILILVIVNYPNWLDASALHLDPNPNRKSRPDLQLCSEGIFRFSSKLQPVYHTRRRFDTVIFNAERQAENLRIITFLFFGLILLGIEPESIIAVADALSTRPLIRIVIC